VAGIALEELMEAEAETYETPPREARNWAMGCHLIALVGLLGNGLGFLVGPLIGIFDVVLTFIGGVKAANGEHWRYPLTIRFLK
jgi:uncharacterized Tic20 family protein